MQNVETNEAYKFPILYTTTAKLSVQLWEVRVIQNEEGHGVIIINRGLMGGKIQTHDQVIKSGKNLGKKNETSPYTQAISEAQSKWNLKKTKNGYVTDMPESGKAVKVSSTDGISPMLAKDFKKDSNKLKWDEGVVCQVKLDGVRALCGFEDGEIFLKSRGNKYYHNLGHIKEAFKSIYESGNAPPTVLFDCELYSNHLKFEDITGICRKQKVLSEKESEKEMKIEAHIFDLYDISTPDAEFHERYDQMRALVTDVNPSLVVVETWGGFSAEDLEELHERVKSKGYEGIMLRNNNGKYKPGPTRSNDLIKMKSMIDDEFSIVDFREGVGQEAGTVIWVCETNDGNEFAVRPMGTREQRREWFASGEDYLGAMLTVRFQEWSKDGIPRFPVGVDIRDYE